MDLMIDRYTESVHIVETEQKDSTCEKIIVYNSRHSRTGGPGHSCIWRMDHETRYDWHPVDKVD